jgi:hypothetical protein
VCVKFLFFLKSKKHEKGNASTGNNWKLCSLLLSAAQNQEGRSVPHSFSLTWLEGE